MKVKQVVHITDIDDFIRGDYSGCFSLFDHESNVQKWVALQEIEIEVDLNFEDIRAKAIRVTDNEIEDLKTKMSAEMKRLTDRKQELLAISYEPAT